MRTSGIVYKGANCPKEGIVKMNHRKRIALFVGQADESYQSRFISGFLEEAFAAGYDVCIFSMYRKYQDTPEREQGESNIFSLMSAERFVSAVILKDSIQTENAADILTDFFNLRHLPAADACLLPAIVII